MHPQEAEVCCDDHDKVSLCLAALMNIKSKHDPLSQYHQQDKLLWLLTQDVEKYGISCLYKNGSAQLWMTLEGNFHLPSLLQYIANIDIRNKNVLFF